MRAKEVKINCRGERFSRNERRIGIL